MILSVDGILLISTMLHFIEIRDYLQSLKISSQKITVFQRKSIPGKLKFFSIWENGTNLNTQCADKMQKKHVLF
jgi:hypothetical protein